jgi:hypothetical protein
MVDEEGEVRDSLHVCEDRYRSLYGARLIAVPYLVSSLVPRRWPLGRAFHSIAPSLVA